MASTDPKDQQPLSTQGDSEEKEEQLGGTTNLSLDQLKKEGDPAQDNSNRPGNTDNQDRSSPESAGDDRQ
ncbi:MAG: hypothetical protein ACTHJ8_09840 [Mucilaginibacter sp.]